MAAVEATGSAAEAPRKNRIQVSQNKKPLFFYVNLAKKFMQQYNEVELSALGMAIATVVTVVEILKNNGLAIEKRIATSTIDIGDESRNRSVQKAKMEIVLEKSAKFDELMAASAEENAPSDGKIWGRSSSSSSQDRECSAWWIQCARRTTPLRSSAWTTSTMTRASASTSSTSTKSAGRRRGGNALSATASRPGSARVYFHAKTAEQVLTILATLLQSVAINLCPPVMARSTSGLAFAKAERSPSTGELAEPCNSVTPTRALRIAAAFASFTPPACPLSVQIIEPASFRTYLQA